MEIAFLGLGNMGAAMAGRLLDAGHGLRVWNRNAEKMKPLTARGAAGRASAREAVADAAVVMSSLMDDESVRNVFAGAEGAMTAMKPKAIHLCTTTISPGAADWLAAAHKAAGSRYVSGPVVGRPDAAAAGTLVEFLAGDASAMEEVTPMCGAFAARIIPLAGAASVANKQKLGVNFSIAALIETMAECLTFVEKSGGSRELMGEFYQAWFAHAGLKGYAARMTAQETKGEGGFSMQGGYKDVGLMLDAARETGCRLEIAEIVREKMRECLDHGLTDVDWSAVQRASRANAGMSRGW